MFLKYDAYQKWTQFAALNEAKKNEDKDKTDVEKASGPDPKIQAAMDDVSRCASFIMGKYKFFAELIFKLKPVYTRAVQTMATDGKRIFVNPDYCATLKDREIIFVLCHEILHNVMGHFSRMTGRDHELWNIATDLEINPFLVEEKLLTKEQLKNEMHGLYEDEFLGLAAEEIYARLQEIQSKMPKNQGQGQQGQGQQGQGQGQQGQGQGQQGQGQGQSGGGSGKGGKGQMPKGNWIGEVMPTQQGDKLDPDGEGSGGSGKDKDKDKDGKGGSDGKDFTDKQGDLKGQGQGKGEGDGDGNQEGQDGSDSSKSGQNQQGGTGKGSSNRGGAEGWDGSAAKQAEKQKGDNIAKVGDVERLADKWKTMSEQAAQVAGTKMGAGLRGLVMQNVKPAVNWKKELEKFIGKVMNEREATIPNRRFVHNGTYIYGMRKKQGSVGNVVVFIDTSGSMSNEQITQFLGEVGGIIEAKKPKKTDVAYFDTDIQAVDSIKNNRKVFDLDKAKGGGGTSFAPCLRWIQDNIIKKGDDVELVVFFTDGYNFDSFSRTGSNGVHEIGMPRPPYFQKWIWVITDDAGRRISTPWGKRIDILTRDL